MARTKAPEGIAIYYVLHNLVLNKSGLTINALHADTRVRTYVGCYDAIDKVLQYAWYRGWVLSTANARWQITLAGAKALKEAGPYNFFAEVTARSGYVRIVKGTEHIAVPKGAVKSYKQLGWKVAR